MTNPYYQGGSPKKRVLKPKARPGTTHSADEPDEIDLSMAAEVPPQEVWDNCPKCGWFYKQSKLDICPMCRHPWRIRVSYTQPPFEGPDLE